MIIDARRLNNDVIQQMKNVVDISNFCNERFKKYRIPFTIKSGYQEVGGYNLDINTALLISGSNQYLYKGELGDIEGCLQALLDFYNRKSPNLVRQLKQILDELSDDIDKKFGDTVEEPKTTGFGRNPGGPGFGGPGFGGPGFGGPGFGSMGGFGGFHGFGGH